MDARLRRRLEMAVRGFDYLRATRDGVAEGAASHRLESWYKRARCWRRSSRRALWQPSGTEMRGGAARAQRASCSCTSRP